MVEDPTAAAACADAYEAYADSCEYPTDNFEACMDAWKGTLEGGEACQFGTQCESAYCQIDENECGTCATYAAEGESCAENQCDGDTFCNDDEICESYRAEGEVCYDGETYYNCDFDTYCDYDLETPVCVAYEDQPDDDLPEPGDPCSLEDYDPCDVYETTLICGDDGNDDLIGVCTQVVAVEAGGSCNGGEDDYSGENWCLHGFTTHYCNIGDDGTGTCDERPGVGEPCADFVCNEAVATCDFNSMPYTCVALPGEGEPCPNYSCVEGYYCDDPNFDDEEPGTCVSYADYALNIPMCMEP